MDDELGWKGPLLARCIVCRGNIHRGDLHELWEGGYYCDRHSATRLRERARLYGQMLHQEANPTDLH